MDIKLKSEELKSFFGTDTLTDVMAEKRKNNIELNIRKSPISQDLLDDLGNILKHHQSLLRHTTILNNSGAPLDFTPIVEVLEQYRSKANYDSLKELRIISLYEQDFDLDLSRLKNISVIDFDKKGGATKLRIDPQKLPKSPSDGKLALTIRNLDVSELDIRGTQVKELRLFGNETKGFSGIKGLENLTNLNIISRQYDREFLDMIDFINSPNARNLHSIFINNVDLGSVQLFNLIQNTNLANIAINKSNIRDLTGLDKFKTRLARLNLKNNNLDGSAVEILEDFFAAFPTMDLVVSEGNPDLANRLNNAVKNGLTQLTIDNILRSYNVSDGDRVFNPNDALFRLIEDPTIPISIKDAEKIRRQAGIVNNPIEFDKDLDIESFDFEQDYLKDGTLLLDVEQVEKLIQSGKKIPMKIAVQIKNVSEISRDDIARYKSKAGIDEVRVITDDGYRCTNAPYSANEYYYIRGVLDEIVSGIDPEEDDIDKLATIYERIRKTIKYDHSCVKKDTAEQIRHAAKENYSCRNLLNGLTTESCVCAGYADILRQALGMVGIEAKYLYGECFGDPDFYAGHAWVAAKLRDENGDEKYYLLDPTWDASNDDYQYFLIDGPTFTRKGHRVYESTDVPEFAQKEYNPERKRMALSKAKGRYYNPREKFLEKYRQEREEAKKKQEEKKKPEEKKPEEKKTEEKKTTEKRVFKPSDELKEKMAKAESVRHEMDSIYYRLDTTLGLSNKGEYYRKLSELEDKYKKLLEDIEKQKEEEEKTFKKSEKKKEEKKPEEKKSEEKKSGEKKPEEKRPEEKKPEEKKPEEKKADEKKEENKGNQLPELEHKKTEEEIKKSKEENEEEKARLKAIEESVKYNSTQKVLNIPQIATRDGLIAVKKKSRIDSLEQGYVNFMNRVFKRDISKPNRVIRGIIRFGVNARFAIQNGIRKVFNLKDPYQEEINAINNSSPIVTEEKEDVFKKTKLDYSKAKSLYETSELKDVNKDKNDYTK